METESQELQTSYDYYNNRLLTVVFGAWRRLTFPFMEAVALDRVEMIFEQPIRGVWLRNALARLYKICCNASKVKIAQDLKLACIWRSLFIKCKVIRSWRRYVKSAAQEHLNTPRYNLVMKAKRRFFDRWSSKVLRRLSLAENSTQKYKHILKESLVIWSRHTIMRIEERHKVQYHTHKSANLLLKRFGLGKSFQINQYSILLS